MTPVTINAKDFATRQEIDDFVKNELTDDIQANRLAGHMIVGTEEELKNLSLSPSSRVWGVKCVLQNK